MVPNSQSHERPVRVNPFLFPPETNSTFYILIAAVAGISLLIFNMVYNAIPGVLQNNLYKEDICGWRADQAAQAAPDNLSMRVDTYERCMLPEDLKRAAFIFVGMLFLFTVSAVIYHQMPIWIIKRQNMQPISVDGDPQLIEYLSAVCKEFAVTPMPQFYWAPLSPERHGVTFGRLKEYFVYLPGGLVEKYQYDEPAFKAELLHELAHLKNRDVDFTYFSTAVWWGFIFAVLLPFFLVQPYAIGRLGKSIGSLFVQLLRLGGLTLLVYLTRASLLRIRENYADARSALWDGRDGALGRILTNLSPDPRPDWKKAFSFHPDPTERVKILDNAAALFDMSFARTVGVGIAATIAYSGIAFWLSCLTPPSLFLDFMELFLTALVFAPLVVGSVGLGIWRRKFAEFTGWKSHTSLIKLGLGTGVGALIGQLLNLTAIHPFVIVDLLWYILLIFSLVLFFHWMDLSASIWLKVSLQEPEPRPFIRSGMIFASAFLTLWFSFLFFSSPMGEEIIGAIPYVAFIKTPFPFVGFMILWGYPMAAWFWRRGKPQAEGARWYDAREPIQWPQPDEFHMKLVLGAGGVGGLAFLLVSLFVGGFIMNGAILNIFPIEWSLWWAISGQTVLATMIQMIITILVAVNVKQQKLIHGMFAALVGAFLMMNGASVVYMFLNGSSISYFLSGAARGSFLGLSANFIIYGMVFSLLIALFLSWRSQHKQR